VAAKDPRVREHAIRALGDRRSRAAVPVLVGRLKEEEPRLAHRIVGALAQIGDERAVPALIEVSRAADGAVTARVARHIGDIGGAEAEGYLLTLASGHADPRVRKAAREALAEMTARAKEAALAARK
jgi:HEAT repeat protein